MKHSIPISIILAAFAFAAIGEDEPTVVTASATLKDSSTVKGEFRTERIVGLTLFMEKLELDAALVKSVSFSGTNGESKVELANGDKFAMTISNKDFAIKSLLGDLAIPRENFRSLALSRKTASGGESGLIFHCTFDDEAALATPVVGPAVKLELGSIATDKARTGGALFVEPGVAGAQVAFPAETFSEEGCIEFWANMASGKTEFTTGGDPRFFVLTDKTGAEVAHFEYASNNGCGNSGLGGHLCGFRTQTNTGYSYMMPYSAIFKGENYNGWHHYAFVWSPSKLTIFLDGKAVCHTDGNINLEQITNSNLVMDIPLNRKAGKSFNNKSAFYMDDLKIWNYAKTDFSL